mmetsp:Transcript_114708/g.180596  ORF Transcript_114708/g.180596 Transcript_114708/m.180596 type:complete len:129 (-) Transcript_114708:392-778(-)
MYASYHDWNASKRRDQLEQSALRDFLVARARKATQAHEQVQEEIQNYLVAAASVDNVILNVCASVIAERCHRVIANGSARQDGRCHRSVEHSSQSDSKMHHDHQSQEQFRAPVEKSPDMHAILQRLMQ